MFHACSSRGCVTRAFRTAVRWADVFGWVEARLEAAGAVEELAHLHGMSLEELDILVARELADAEVVLA